MRIIGIYGVTLLVVSSWSSFGVAAGDAGALNDSFEPGGDSASAEGPTGWSRASTDRAGVKGTWLSDESRTGARALGGESQGAHNVWVSERIPVRCDTKYIVDGWIKPTSGSAWLEVCFRDAKGKALGTWTSPRVSGNVDWTYVALETGPARNDSAPASAEMAFCVRNGRAALDDVGVHPDSPIEAANAGFEAPPDQKGRIPYWSEDKENPLLPGTRSGSVALSGENAFEGTGCLAVTVSGAWFAVSSVPYCAWPWWQDVELTAMARCEPGCQIQLLVAWVDAAQRFLSAGAGDPVESRQWQRVTSGKLKPPKGAYAFRPVFLVKRKAGLSTGSATAWIDSAELRVRQKPFLRVVVNQIGYEEHGPKTAVVLTNFFPKNGPRGKVEIVRADGGRERVQHMDIACAGRMYGQGNADWGWYFWRADFSSLKEAGQYQVRAEIGKEEGVSYPFRIGQDLLFQETAAANVDFFFVQRCGCEVPGWHAPCHLDDAKLKDGTHRDLVGGWHSAGDYNKLTWEYGDGGVLYALVHAANAAPEYFARYDRNADGLPDALDEASWGAQYLAKLEDPATGGLLNHIEQGPDKKTWMNWCPPEKTTDNVVGTADDPIVQDGEGHSPLAIGGWALLGQTLTERRVPNDYLARSVGLWEHATAATAAASAASDPLLLLSSVDLYLVTGEERYLAFCRRCVEGLLASGDAHGKLGGGYGDTGDIPAAALAYFALKLPAEPLSEAIKTRLAKHLPAFLAEAANPLGLMMQKPGADGYYFEPTSAFGCNYQFCCRAWSALMVYRVTRDRRALQYAVDQLDFVLGKNPYNLCMFEGKGSCNLPRYHHRYITIPGHQRGAVPGAIPNGFVRDIVGRDRPGVDLSTGGRPYPSYRTNEPWLVHNVFYTLAVTALHEALR